jgi:organic radical activating enzyme
MVEYVIFGWGAVGKNIARNLGEPRGFYTVADDKIFPGSVDLTKQTYPDATYIIAAADLKMATERLNGHFWVPAFAFVGEPLDRFEEYAIETCLACQRAAIFDNKLFMRSLDIMVTERCTLKCRDCSNLMQHYKKPEDLLLYDVVRGIDAISWETNEVRLIGGEPFLYKYLDSVIIAASLNENIRFITVYTNGTLLPNDGLLEVMAVYNVIVLITEYKGLSRRAEPLRQLLDGRGITHHTIPTDYWTDCGQIFPRNRTIEELRETFATCCGNNLYTLCGTKLYRCPFSANAHRLGLIPGNHIDITKERSIKDFMEVDAISSCHYCAGRPFGAPTIEPAVQL